MASCLARGNTANARFSRRFDSTRVNGSVHDWKRHFWVVDDIAWSDVHSKGPEFLVTSSSPHSHDLQTVHTVHKVMYFSKRILSTKNCNNSRERGKGG